MTLSDSFTYQKIACCIDMNKFMFRPIKDESFTTNMKQPVFMTPSRTPSPFVMPAVASYVDDLDYIYSGRDTPLMLEPPILSFAISYRTLSPILKKNE